MDAENLFLISHISISHLSPPPPQPPPPPPLPPLTQLLIPPPPPLSPSPLSTKKDTKLFLIFFS